MQVRNRGDLGANSSVFVRAAHFQRALILREHASATIGIRIELGHFGMNREKLLVNLDDNLSGIGVADVRHPVGPCFVPHCCAIG